MRIPLLGSIIEKAIWSNLKKGWDDSDKKMKKKLDHLLQGIYREFGWKTKMIAPLIGVWVYVTLKFEQRRLSKGWTYEPPVFYEKNKAALDLKDSSISRVVPEIRGVGGKYAPSTQ